MKRLSEWPHYKLTWAIAACAASLGLLGPVTGDFFIWSSVTLIAVAIVTFCFGLSERRKERSA